jgi:hypothetical protein
MVNSCAAHPSRRLLMLRAETCSLLAKFTTGITCRTGKRLGETRSNSLGNALLPKSKVRQIFLATCFYKAEQFMLKSRQRYDSTLAIAPGKAHNSLRAYTRLARSDHAGASGPLGVWGSALSSARPGESESDPAARRCHRKVMPLALCRYRWPSPAQESSPRREAQSSASWSCCRCIGAGR